MAAELSNPVEWIGPTLRQARADYDVASSLVDQGVPGEIYGGECPVDAALDKYQQALEKALKGIVLHAMPERSDLAFGHRLLTGQRAKDRRIRIGLRKALQALNLAPGCRASFEALESLIPDAQSARLDKDGLVHSLPENTQYPFRSAESGRAVAPCDAMRASRRGLPVSLRKSLGSLFNVLRRTPDYAEYFKASKLR